MLYLPCSETQKIGFVSYMYMHSLYQLVPNFNPLVSECELNDRVFIYTWMCCGNYWKQTLECYHLYWSIGHQINKSNGGP